MELKLWLFATLFGVSLQVAYQSEIPICNVDGENSPEKCCPIYGSADQCPYNYQLINSTSDVCEDDNDNLTTIATTAIPGTTTLTTDDTTTIVNNTKDEAKGDEDEEMPEDIKKEISICKKCDEYEHFNNEEKICEKCDKKCLSCDKEALSNCTVCKYEHEDECHSECPEGLVPGKKTENGSRLCEKEIDDDDGLPIAIIAGAAGGGGALLIIVIVVIVCCCCRRSVARQDKERLTMSVILEQQQSNESSTTVQETENKPKDQRRRKNYENMEQTMPGTQDIVRQQDVIGRYTRDPTLEPKRKGKDKTEEEDDSGGYANHAMVQLAKTTNLTSVDSSRLEKQLEEKELEMLPQAPGAPAIPVPTSAKPQKQGIVKRLSQRLVKQKKGKSKDKSPAAPADQENSPMTQSSSNLVPDNKDTGEENMEDYENITISGTQGRKAMCTIAKALDDNMEIYENVSNNQQIDPVAQAAGSVGNVDDLEDYENTMNFRKPDNGVPEGGNDVVGSDGEPTGDLEDYENMKELEPYENVSFAQAHGRKAGK